MGASEDKIWTAPFSVDNDYFQKCVRQSADLIPIKRQDWCAGSSTTVFLFCGKLIGKKAPEVLLDAFRNLVMKNTDVRLVYVGDGTMRTELEARASGLPERSIHWEGFVNQSGLATCYAAADVLVVPSRNEPWGLVVNESLACGTPAIVSSRVGAGPDLVEQWNTGLIFDTDSVTALEESMARACDPELRNRWKRNIPAALNWASFDEDCRVIVKCLTSIRNRPDHKGTLDGCKK